MGFAKIPGELTSRIGRKVRFGPPKDIKKAGGGARFGRIIDEVWADEEVNRLPAGHSEDRDDWGDYSFCAQLIEWGHDKSRTIRLAYYRRRPNEDSWEFASQTTVHSNRETIKKLLQRTLQKVDWFSDLKANVR